MASNQNIIRRILGAQALNRSEVADAIWKMISDKSHEEQIELLSVCFKERDSVPKSEHELKNLGLSNEEWAQLTNTQYDFISAYLKNAFFNGRTPEEFSNQILKLINFYESDKEKIYCIATCLFSDYIPFHTLPGEALRIPKERIRHLLGLNNEKVELIDYINKLPFSSYPEECTHILHIIDDVENLELRACLLGYYMVKKQELLKEQYSR